MRDKRVLPRIGSRSVAVNSSSYQRLCVSRPTKANTRPMAQAVPKQAMAMRLSESGRIARTLSHELLKYVSGTIQEEGLRDRPGHLLRVEALSPIGNS